MTQQSDLQTERIYMAEHDKLKLQQAIRIQTPENLLSFSFK